ncbi:MAG: hypothetical protein RPU15_16810 [Candidatus Sedimenticola sp. (ex Thyasira tokunagai)]
MLRRYPRIFWPLLIWFLASIGAAYGADPLRPYVLSSHTRGNFIKTIIEVKEALVAGGFELAGEYTPYADAHIIVVTNEYLKKQVQYDGNLAFALGQRVSVTRLNDRIQVAYTNPDYFQSAYRIYTSLAPVRQALQEVLGRQETFGAKGLTAEKLRSYHYSYGMEYFNDQLLLAEYPDQDSAVRVVQGALDRHAGGVHAVYRIDAPGRPVTVFGVAMTYDFSSDEAIMAAVDRSSLRHTARLPYEIVVDRGKVVALHPRFRLGVNFPDLKMVGEHSFISLREAPAAITRALYAAAGNEK